MTCLGLPFEPRNWLASIGLAARFGPVLRVFVSGLPPSSDEPGPYRRREQGRARDLDSKSRQHEIFLIFVANRREVETATLEEPKGRVHT